MESRTTRLPKDLLDAAESEAAEAQRSTAKQVEYWARFGMFFDGLTSASRRRIEQAVAGELALAELDDDEQVAANAEISGNISTAANETSFADRLAARGVATVVMEEDGSLTRRGPDGDTTEL